MYFFIFVGVVVFIYFPIFRALGTLAIKKKYWGLTGIKKTFIYIILIVLIILPIPIGLNFFVFNTFSNDAEVFAKGKIIKYERYSRGPNLWIYQYKALDGSYYKAHCNYVPFLGSGDTIDIVYDKDEVDQSYAPFEKCYPIMGNWGINMKYKKYWDQYYGDKKSKSK